MKRSTLITVVSLLIPLLGMGQSKPSFVDDVYLKPSDAKTTESPQPNGQTQKTPNYKNGAREIIYTKRDNPAPKAKHDTLYVVGEENDSTVNNQEQGYYLNGFNGTESDQEYAERIRRFHNPKYEIFIGDPRYNDIYFLNNYDWNVYVDGSYAYVTPTWTNPYWWNYNFSPYSYGGWGFGFNNWYSPYSYYSGLYGSPWGFDSFYGGFGYGGYGFGYGYGYGGYCGYGGYGGYEGYGYNNWYGNNSSRNQNHNEGTRRDISNLSAGGRMGGTNSSSQTMIGGGGYYTTNPYTVVSGSKTRAGSQSNGSTPTGLRATNNSSKVSTSRSIPVNTNGIGQVRSGGLRNLSGINQSNINRTSGSRPSYTINTTPRTSTRNNSTSGYNPATGNSSPSRSGNSAVINSNSRNYSTGSRSSSPSSSFSPNRSNSSYSNSSPSYNNGSSSSRSSSSYSTGGNSGSSSGSSSGGSRSSSSSSSSGGSGGRR